MTITAEYVADVLTARAAPYGGTFTDMMNKTPVCLWDNPDDILTFWEGKDLSHIYPQSTYPELADVWDNIVPEDAAVNRARGASIMTDLELSTAIVDAEVDASIIDLATPNDDPEFAQDLIDLMI